MVLTIRKRLIQFFRFHTSGDLQSLAHLQNIIKVAKLTPETKHWLPTREYDIVRQIEEQPENLVIRVSAHKIDGEFYHTSKVVTVPKEGDGYVLHRSKEIRARIVGTAGTRTCRRWFIASIRVASEVHRHSFGAASAMSFIFRFKALRVHLSSESEGGGFFGSKHVSSCHGLASMTLFPGRPEIPEVHRRTNSLPPQRDGKHSVCDM